MISGIGPTELIIVLVIVLLIFGPKRLPGLGKQLGNGMREFKDTISRGDRGDGDDAPAAVHAVSVDGGRGDAEAALGHPDGEPVPVDGRATGDSAPR